MRVVDLDDARLAKLIIPRWDAAWHVEFKSGERRPFAECTREIDAAFGARDVFISVDQEPDGQHLFVRLRGDKSLVTEAQVKMVEGAHLLYARLPGQAPVTADWHFPDMAPHGPFTNYSIVPWLCLGRTQALILTDEATLTRDLPREKIFDHLTLVVNCHEDKVNITKYRAGVHPDKPRPEVIANAVHRWRAKTAGTIEKNDAIQRAIWHHLQHGSVAVHCLAGIHRAACIVACHFLFRHYVLGHSHIPAQCSDIYAKLQSVRPAVSPAYLDILRSYESYCKHAATMPPPDADANNAAAAVAAA